MTNIYKKNYIDNLPSGVTYDSDIARFFFNGKRHVSVSDVEWYRKYINKFGVAFNVTLSSDNTFEISGGGTVTLTITEQPLYNGTYTVDTDAALNGPVEVVAVRATASEPVRHNDTIEVTPALWIYSGDDLTIEWELLSDGVVVATATEPSLTLPPGLEGTDLTVRESAENMQTGLSLSLSSPALSTPAAAPTLSSYFEHDGAFELVTPSPVITASDPDFLVFISHEVGAGNNALHSIAEMTPTATDWNIEFARWMMAYTNAGVQLRSNTGPDARGQLVSALYHAKTSGPGSFNNVSWTTDGVTWGFDPRVFGANTDTGWSLADEPIRIFSEIGTTGKVWRLAIWPSPGSIDIEDSAVREAFVNTSGGLLLPATSHTLLGTPTLDFNAHATNATSGGHDGSLGTLTVNTAPTIGTV